MAFILLGLGKIQICMLDKIKAATAFIQAHTQMIPDHGIILGTGLGALVENIEITDVIEYKDIPHFPVSTLEFHKGRLIFGKLVKRNVVIMQGRFHYYEGYNMQEVTFPVRVLRQLGIRRLFISNAAGGVNPEYEVSDLMILSDHINLLPENPLRGQNFDELGPRFPDMSEPYDLSMIEIGLKVAREHGIPAHKGVYAVVMGPNLETEAEYRYIRIIGADVVGMSTVPENIVARHMGIPCFAISVITDLGIPGRIEKVNVEKIIAAAVKAEPGMTTIIEGILKSL